ncbi:CoxG family protein [Thermoplasma sp.]|uniref:SRPBCC domain-containing protein n=1 Tax=Thermoplasma sp. TaxID=1973142 RepID=UPI00261BCBF3|nr:CoxG family protein [Thermoplasma sp.]
MIYSGSIEIKIPDGAAIELLHDPEKLGPCLPGVSSFEKETEGYSCKVKLDVSSMKSSYLSKISGKLNFSYVNAEDRQVRIQGKGRIVGSSISFDLTIEVHEGKLQWSIDVNYGILIKMMGEEKIKEVTEENIERTVKCLSQLLSSD